MRSVTQLIKQIRNQTENEEFSDFQGINDTEFLQYLNDAQYNLQSLIIAQHPDVFIKEKIVSTSAGVQEYALPSDCFLGNKVNHVEYSATGSEQDYYTLDSTSIKNKNPGVEGYPGRYIRYNGKLLLTPTPASSGSLRINYIYRLPALSKTAAVVGQKTETVIIDEATQESQINNVDTVVSSTENFTIQVDNNVTPMDQDLLSNYDFICLVDTDGNPIISNIEIDSLSFSEIVCKPHTLASGEPSIIPLGAKIIGGKDSSTHSELGIEIERYLIAYCAWKILKRDSSVDSQEAMQELSSMAQEIVKTYANINDDIVFIPELNSWDDWSF